MEDGNGKRSVDSRDTPLLACLLTDSEDRPQAGESSTGLRGNNDYHSHGPKVPQVGFISLYALYFFCNSPTRICTGVDLM